MSHRRGSRKQETCEECEQGFANREINSSVLTVQTNLVI